MRRIRVHDVHEFRTAARTLVAAGVRPGDVEWSGGSSGTLELDLGGSAAVAPVGAGALSETVVLSETVALPETVAPSAPGREVVAPRSYIEAMEWVALHASTSRWALLYRLLWRLNDGEPRLMRVAGDADVAMATAMQKAVRRELHKMKAFVRFRRVVADGDELFVAWFEPEHDVVELAAQFFSRRFPSMHWMVNTPLRCAHWDGEHLRLLDGVDRDPWPSGDPADDLWRTYYGSTFNPARLSIRAMQAEMPKRYWRNMPETVLIPQLIQEAPRRVRRMVEAAALAAREVEVAAHPETGAATGARGGQRAAPHDIRDALRGVAGVAAAAPAVVLDETPRIRVGVAGWDYPDWAGPVYPSGCRGADRLRLIASQCDVVEVNSSFYRPMSAKAARRWATEVADRPRFRFAAKLYRAFTHERGVWSDHDVRQTRVGLEALLESGRLSSVLVQFPWSFRDAPETRRRLARICDAFSMFPLHVELRHRCWDMAALHDWLSEREIGWTNIDQPIFPGSLEATAHAGPGASYIRLHGRNAADWFRADAGRDERYDYSYSEDELLPWVVTARSLATEGRDVLVVFNNHYRGQAVRNAEAFARLVRG